MSQRLPPPCDMDAEASVLSALMLDPERVAGVSRFLAPGDFYSDANRRVAQAIWDIDAAGTALDITAVASRLRADGTLAAIGGTPYLAQLTDATPAVAHVEDHARVVAAAARIRRVQAVCQVAAAEGYAALGNAPEWLGSVQRRVCEATDDFAGDADTIAVLVDAIALEYGEIQRRSRSDEQRSGRRTRIQALDRILNGLVDSVPYVLAGRPGHGKTAAAWQIAEGVARGDELVVFLSQEMPLAQLTMRAIAQASGVEPDALRSGRLEPADWTRIADGIALIQHLPIAIDDRAGHTVHSARSSVRRCVQKLRAAGHRHRLGLVVVDYLQIMADERQRGDSRASGVAESMHGLTRLAKEFACPVLVLSQLNRELEKRPDKRPKLSDLGESGAIEADAYGVMFIFRADVYRDRKDHDNGAEIIVAKHRNGRCGTAQLHYCPSTLLAAVTDEYDDLSNDFDEGDADRRYP